MTLKKFDDSDNSEIPLNAGLEVTLQLADGTRKVRHYAVWAHVPAGVLDGTVAGQAVAGITIRDLSLVNRPATQVPATQAPATIA